MKLLALPTIALVLATSAGLWANDDQPSAKKPEAAKTKPVVPPSNSNPPWTSKSSVQWYIGSIDPVVGLTDEQKKEITDVIEQRDRMMQEIRNKLSDELSAASKALGEAYKNSDKEAIAKAQKAYQEIYAPFHQAMKESQKKLDDILTSKQREALKKPFQVWGQARGGFGSPAGNAESIMVFPGSRYWIGLSAVPVTADQSKKLELPAGQGLDVQTVAPESPAAKAGIVSHDVIVKAGDKTIMSLQDLIGAIEQSKDKDLVLQIVREGKKQKITVKPGKRPAEGMLAFQGEGALKGWETAPEAKVYRLPGGGLSVIIGEGAEGKAAPLLEPARKELGEKAAASAQAILGERLKRQHELVKSAWQAYQKLQSLRSDKKGESHELWEQIERLEAELRQTFEPAGFGMSPVPGAPMAGGWMGPPPGQFAPGAPDFAGRAAFPPGHMAPGGPRPDGEPRMNAAIQELRNQVEKLRRDVEELKARSKKQ